MSTAPVSSSSIYQELQAYFQQRNADVQQLGKDLKAGSLAEATQDFNALQTLGQSGPSAKGDVFEGSRREQALTAVGQALSAGDLAGAQSAFAQLQSPYQSSTASSAAGSSPAGSIYQQRQAFFQQRGADVQQLGQDLAAGNVTNAEQDYTALQTLGQSGPFKSGNTFANSQREQDFNAIGQALQSGDLSAAQQAFAQLQATYQPQQGPTLPVEPQASPAAASGTEIILNLANAPAGEQITIGLTNEANGTEQVSISASNPQSQTPEQILLNVNPNTNQQIVLNLFGNQGSNSQGPGLNAIA